MKTLATIEGHELVALDGQYIIYDVIVVPETSKDGTANKTAGMTRQTNPRYYGRLEYAVDRLCTLAGNDLCEDLHSWLAAYKQARDTLLATLRDQAGKMDTGTEPARVARGKDKRC